MYTDGTVEGPLGIRCFSQGNLTVIEILQATLSFPVTPYHHIYYWLSKIRVVLKGTIEGAMTESKFNIF